MKIKSISIIAISSLWRKAVPFAALIIGMLGVLSLSSCCENRIEDVEDQEITDVLDGNTIVLKNGLTVHIIGVTPNNPFTKQLLENNYIDKPVSLIPDSDGEDTFVSFDDTVWAYVDVEGKDLGEILLRSGGKEAYSTVNLTDRREKYDKLFTDAEPLDMEVLAAKVKGASFFIVFAEPDGNMYCGTGFFINNEGLAVSNAHVVHPGATYAFYLSDTQGNLNKEQAFHLNSIVASMDYKNNEPDYAIFYVDLDPDTKKKLHTLDLTRRNLIAGTEIFTVGNPGRPDNNQLMPMLFKNGSVASNHVDPESAKFDIGIPITHGFSGGPLVNKYGEVIGIGTAGFDNSNAQLNFGTDIQVVRQKLDEKLLPYGGK